MIEGFWLPNEHGELELYSYDDLDPEILGQLWKPVGGFCYPAEGFVRLEIKQVPFYVKDWLPKQGKMLLYAPAKSGKSFLALQLARCIACGEGFLGMSTSQGKVLYLQFELGQEILQSRMVSTGKTYGNMYVGTTFGLKLDVSGGRIALRSALEGVEPSVLILDPLYKIIRGEENESHDMLQVLDYLDALIDAYKLSVVIIHHSGKDISRGSRGSSVLEDYPDSIIEMRKLSKNNEPLRVKLTPMMLRHAELPPEPVEATLEKFEFVVAQPKEKIIDKVEEFIAAQELTTPAALIGAGIGSQKSVYDALTKLVEQGRVERVGKGQYKTKGDKDERNIF